MIFGQQMWSGDCPDWQTRVLKYGDQGACVMLAQSRLAIHGYLSTAGTDGIFGTATENAVKAFQAARGLTPDGIIGRQTWEALMSEPQGCKTLITIRLGDRGPCVKLAQERLALHGYNPGPADGIFGEQTRNSVILFQRTNNLTVDGIVGPQTWNMLMREPGTLPPPTQPPTQPPEQPGQPGQPEQPEQLQPQPQPDKLAWIKKNWFFIIGGLATAGIIIYAIRQYQQEL